MYYKVGYGKGYQEFDLTEDNLLMELRQNSMPIESTGKEEVTRAIREPIGTPRLREIVKQGEKIVIITSDITRPLPGKIVLPVILEELEEAGISKEDISIVFALGNHRNHTEAEMKYLVGDEVYSGFRCLDSNQNDTLRLGITSAGTPVDIFRVVAEADRRICIGNIEYHYFAGYSGGAKAIMPGVSTRDAIQSNHSGMVQDAARAGAMDDNPVRQDMEEVTGYCPIDFILNVVLDEKKTIIKAVAGHHVLAHRAGCRFLDSLYKVRIPKKADIVITSAGGYPKDINLYQAQKALDNAKHAVRDGGIVVLVASCNEGLGEEVFQRWIESSTTPEEMIENIGQNFELGGHKAAAIALVRQKARIFVVSELPSALAKKIFMEPFGSVTTALEEAFKTLGSDSEVLLMPFGGSTLPVVD